MGGPEIARKVGRPGRKGEGEPLEGLSRDESDDSDGHKELVEAERCSVAGVIAALANGTRNLVGIIAGISG
jgi:hypothetical protein